MLEYFLWNLISNLGKPRSLKGKLCQFCLRMFKYDIIFERLLSKSVFKYFLNDVAPLKMQPALKTSKEGDKKS